MNNMQKQNELQNQHNVNQDVPYIHETNDMISLRKYATSEMMGMGRQLGQINMAFDLLKQILFRMYKSTSFDTLISRSVLINESDIFSKHAKDIVSDMRWANKTNLAIFSILKGILKCTSVDSNFINRISVVSPKSYPLSHPYHILPSTYKHLDDSSPEKNLMLKWIDIIKENTKNKSSISIKNMLYFFDSFMPMLDIDVKEWDDEKIRNVIEKNLNEECISQICGDSNKKKLWFKIFCKYITRAKMNDALFARAPRKTIDSNSIFSETRDMHRISVNELEILYEEAKKNLRDELMFLLLLTTGMRIGGLVNIRVEHVADVNDNGVDVKTCGRTLEKGNKWFTFVMNDRVRDLIREWIIKGRHATSPYLFSSRSGSMPYLSRCTVRALFKKMCERAGLSGCHLHPHAIRHTYAHMLLESGNSVDIISKLMGHSNSLTTESFYLKENAVEVASRANIPWLGKPKPEKKIPDFLISKDNKNEKKNTELERKKRLKNLATISNFVIEGK
jgi:site-specific recombinase XerD